jgi:hypothetical protein
MIGRSPTPITAYLELKGLTNITTVPLSFHVPGPISSDEDRYFKHFDEYVPSPEKLEGKEVLLIDFTELGESFQKSRELFINYFKSKNSGTSVKTLALVSPNAFAEHMLVLFGNGILLHNPLGDALENLDFKDYSEYGSCALTTTCVDSLRQQKAPRTQYCDLKTELKKMINKDRVPYTPGTIEIETRKIKSSVKP